MADDRAGVGGPHLPDQRPGGPRPAPVPGPVPPAGGRRTEGGVHRHALQRRLLRALHRPSRWPSGASASSAGTPATAATRRTSCSSTRSIDIGAGVRWLREQAGVETVVILGNSGGGSLMGAYQSQATEPSIEPPSGCRSPTRCSTCRRPTSTSRSTPTRAGPRCSPAWMDPSVTDETDPLSVDPELDMFDPAHGPPYAPEFVERYRAAQVARNDRITAWARAELERLQAGRRVGPPVHHRTGCGPTSGSPTSPSTRRDRKRRAATPATHARPTTGRSRIGGTSTLRSWLSMWSLETSQCRGAPHLAAHHGAVARRAVAGRPRRLPERRPRRSTTRWRADGQGARAASPASTTSRTPAPTTVADLVAGWIARRG